PLAGVIRRDLELNDLAGQLLSSRSGSGTCLLTRLARRRGHRDGRLRRFAVVAGESDTRLLSMATDVPIEDQDALLAPVDRERERAHRQIGESGERGDQLGLLADRCLRVQVNGGLTSQREEQGREGPVLVAVNDL